MTKQRPNWLVPFWIALIFLGRSCPCAHGQTTTTQWVNRGAGNWLLGSNWSNGVPIPSVDAQITNGGTAEAIGTATHVARDVYVGSASRGAEGTLIVQDSTLTARSISVGQGLAVQGGDLELINSQINLERGIQVGDQGTVRVLGNSTVVGYLDNSGSVRMPSETSQLIVQGDFQQLSDGSLDVVVNTDGIVPLQVKGVAQLDGTLNVSFPRGFNPSGNFIWNVVDAGGGVQGEFSNFTVGDPPGEVQLCVPDEAHPNSIAVASDVTLPGNFYRECIDESTESITQEDLDWYAIWLTDPDRYMDKYLLGPSANGGDVNGDGIVDFHDWPDFLSILESECEDCVDFTLIPEPSSLWLGIGLAAVLRRTRHRGNQREF